MPKRTDLESILVVGSGPIVIGQACEFDYSGTQACKALKEEGYRVILVNSNPATIMTDPEFADATYIEPLTADFIERIIAKERPDALLPTVGGQTALNLAVELATSGVLDRYQVQLIGSSLEAIRKAEDRQLFADAMQRCGLEIPRGGYVTSIEEGVALARSIGFPIILRPSFTLGGTGGGIAYNLEEFKEKLSLALKASPIHRVLVEESVIGWKEYELEVMRDRADNVVIVCSIENMDPMGVHTGDSITVAPAQTLTDREYQQMRDAALKVIREIGVDTGGSNIQFAVHPETGRMVVIEMNPRVSRSSALASKATGFPIAKIAAKLAVGYTLDEIPNDITQQTPASFEPSIDYVVTKIPRWDFEKFEGVPDELTVQMRSIGEAMGIGRTFKESLQKAIRSIEKKRYGFGFDRPEYLHNGTLSPEDQENLRNRLRKRTSQSLFDLCDALRYGFSTEEIHHLTGYDPWFIEQCREIVQFAQHLIEQRRRFAFAEEFLQSLTSEDWQTIKAMGFSDEQIATIAQTSVDKVYAIRLQQQATPVFKVVDTCAAEFASSTPYLYSTYEQENEAPPPASKSIVVLGGGPNRIGQGIEFDYCCVQAVFALREEGYESIMINCNPETVSTDYDTASRLYFEPLTLEDVSHVLLHERPSGIILTFGGQTPLKLASGLEDRGFPILGTSPEGIDLAEDRERFAQLLNTLHIPCPQWGIAHSEEEAVSIARSIGYPVLVRPSYVLGGRAMHLCYREETLRKYVREALFESPNAHVLIDQFLEDAYEFDIDAIYDGANLLVGGILQHIEEAGIHSGDSSCVLPPYSITQEQQDLLIRYTHQLAEALQVIGPLNIQFALHKSSGTVYVLEANPRASRTIPFISKATGIPLARIATKVMLGYTLPELGYHREIFLPRNRVAVKESVFPFNKFPKTNHFLGPEMRSTGEVMGIDRDFGRAILKARLAAGNQLPTSGRIFFSISDLDKTPRAVQIARGFYQLGFEIWATKGTATFLQKHGIPAKPIKKHYEGRPSIVDYIKNRDIDMLINTPLGEFARYDEFVMGRLAMEYGIPFFTTLAAAAASLSAIEALRKKEPTVQSLQEYYAEESFQ